MRIMFAQDGAPSCLEVKSAAVYGVGNVSPRASCAVGGFLGTPRAATGWSMIGELFQSMHLPVIAVIVLFVFGPNKLPRLGRTLGKAARELRGAMNEPDEVTRDTTK